MTPLETLVEPGSVVELRVPVRQGRTISGYFDNLDTMAAAAAKLSGRHAGIYFTANPVNPALIARYNNRLEDYARATTGDHDVARRRWLPIDLDPVRPAGIASTDTEHEIALERARQVRAHLVDDLGWPGPVMVDSGNGAYVLCRIDLPNDDASRELVKQCLEALGARFDDDQVHVDTTMHNAARIVRVPGTLNCKGDSTPDRPHRTAQLLHTPDPLEVVAGEQLQTLAATLPTQEPFDGPSRNGQAGGFDLEAFIRAHLEAAYDKPWKGGGRRWILKVCPFNSDHAEGSAWVARQPSGAIAAGCQHYSCKTWGWAELRERYEPKPARQTPRSGKPGRGFRLTDLGNAERLVHHHGDDLRYCHLWRKWLVWDGRRWKVDDTGEIMRRAKDTAIAIYAEAAEIKAKGDGEDAEAKAQAKRDAIVSWAGKSQASARLKAMIELAASEQDIPVLPDQLDRDPWALNCRNGTIAIQDDTLRPHSRADLITKLAGVDYDPQAQAPTWTKFLQRVMGEDEDLIGFLQRAVGYSLTGDVGEEVIFIPHGTGANGKTKFLEAIQSMLGDYAQEAPSNLLTAKRNDGIPNDVARLMGARFVAASETGQDHDLNEALVKDLTGGDTITARFLFAEYFQFTPTHKLWLSTNHRPKVKGVDEGIWRRILLIPFTVWIPPIERDKRLGDKLKAELPGILAWAVQGCLAWRKEGLRPPSKVTQATKDYRAEQDDLGAWIAQRCIIAEDEEEAFKDLYSNYTEWCEAGRLVALNSREFGQALTERGYIGFRKSDTYAFRKDIRLRSWSDPSDDPESTSDAPTSGNTLPSDESDGFSGYSSKPYAYSTQPENPSDSSDRRMEADDPTTESGQRPPPEPDPAPGQVFTDTAAWDAAGRPGGPGPSAYQCDRCGTQRTAFVDMDGLPHPPPCGGRFRSASPP